MGGGGGGGDGLWCLMKAHHLLLPALRARIDDAHAAPYLSCRAPAMSQGVSGHRALSTAHG